MSLARRWRFEYRGWHLVARWDWKTEPVFNRGLLSLRETVEESLTQKGEKEDPAHRF
jgi:hypothetical protein